MKEEKVQTCSEREETRRRGLKRKGDKQEGKEGCNKREEKAEQRERKRRGEETCCYQYPGAACAGVRLDQTDPQ